MKYEYLPRQDRVALEWYIDCLKEISDINIDYEIYEGSNWYIIYLDDNVFDVLEDKIDAILDHNHKLLTIDKEILFAPKRFIVSYEEKIEGCPDIIQYSISAESNFHQSLFTFNYKTKDTKGFNVINRNFSELYEYSDKTTGVKNGCAA